MGDPGEIDLDRVWAVRAAELRRFVAERPRSLACTQRARGCMPGGVPMNWFLMNYPHPPVWVSWARGARFVDVDDHEYVDFLLAICAGFCGHAPQPVAEAVARQVSRGAVLQLPVEDSIWVAEELSRRFGRLRWQFSLTSSQSIQDCIRLARAVTGRTTIVKFDANYHGHVDPVLAVLDGPIVVPEYDGLDQRALDATRVIQFNDVAALDRALQAEDVALVIAEPAMTNIGFILPDPGYHEALRALTCEHGALLLIDETQTLMSGCGGLTRDYGLAPDLLVVGKSMGGGLPFSAYGVCERVAARLEAPHQPYEVSGLVVDEIAIGGTMWANPLSVVAARAALEHVLTPEAYARTSALGERLAAGMERVLAHAGLPWSVQRLQTRASYAMVASSPRNAVQARAADIAGFKDVQRLFMANRGVWDFGWWGGPSLSVAHTAADVDAYLEVFAEFIGEIG
jgi:glutamate-1-semialdehyde 2,1-aminomutase